MMSLNRYKKLQQESIQNPSLIGNLLPELKSGLLEISAEEFNLFDLCVHINEFKANESWVMFSDHIEINNFNPEHGYIIEGEWCKANQSLSVKLMQDDTYLVTRFVYEKNQPSQMAFSEQTLYLRSELKSQIEANACRYRLWWQQVDKGEHRGRWIALAQQFIGFTQVESIEQPSKGGEA